MPTYDSPLQYYLKQKRAFEETPRTARQAYRQVGEGTFRDMRELTSGTLTPRQTRGAYARRGKTRYQLTTRQKNNRGLVAQPPRLPINVQSGRLQRAIRIVHRSDRYTAEDSVFVDPLRAGKSVLVLRPQGTVYMVPRGFWGEVGTRAKARQRAYQDVFYSKQREVFSRP